MKTLGALIFALTVTAGAASLIALEPQNPGVNQPGNEQFFPTPENPVGWRGDGSGRFPAANPPVHWGQNTKAVLELTAQARKPGASDKGTPIPDGIIREWMVIGPVKFVPLQGKEEGLEPAEGAKIGDAAWKLYKADTPYVNFWQLYGKEAGADDLVAAFAHTWLYSASGKPVFLRSMFSCSKPKVWLNGKELEPGKLAKEGNQIKLELEKGWNRLLIRVSDKTDMTWTPKQVQWHFSAAFFGTNPKESVAQNISWKTRMPDNNAGVGSPIVVKDKIFATGEPCLLVCFNKKDGKPLWAAANTYADAMTDEERKSKPDLVKETDVLLDAIKEKLKRYCLDPEKYNANQMGQNEKVSEEKKIYELFTKSDPEKYPGQSSGEAGLAVPTPASDGKYVYVMSGTGVVACFDLDGNRKWTKALSVRIIEHGYNVSPVLCNGYLMVPGNKKGFIFLDCATGEVAKNLPLWKNINYIYCNTPLIVKAGGEKLLVGSNGVIMRMRDDKVIENRFIGTIRVDGNNPTPSAENKTVCFRPKYYTWVFITLPETLTDSLKSTEIKMCALDLSEYPAWFAYDHCASPLLYNGLAYLLSVDGVLSVVDCNKGTLVYQKLLDLSPLMRTLSTPIRSGCSSSPALAGRYIYLWDDQGSTVVIEPGPVFKQVARNRIEELAYRWSAPSYNETTVSCPVFEGSRLYYRGSQYLYCIEEKQ